LYIFKIYGHFIPRLPKFILQCHLPIQWFISYAFQINQPTRCNNFSSLLLDIYAQLNMFRASSRPSSGTQQLK
jgi:hypothetical protein